MTEKELSESVKVGELINTDFNTLLAKAMVENPDINNFLYNGARKLKEFLERPQTQEFAKKTILNLRKISQTLSEPAFIEGVSRFFELPRKRREAVLAMSESGWFPFEESLLVVPKDNQSIDEYMINVIEENYSDLKKRILTKYLNRKEILEVAFSLFEQGNYIAAIPLLLTQIDGISNDNHGIYYFTGEKFPVHLKEKAKKGWDVHTYDLFNAILEKAQKTFISERFEGLKGKINELNILNRAGILHGDKDFLDYGTKPNAHKVISLLLYVDFMSDLLDEEAK